MPIDVDDAQTLHAVPKAGDRPDAHRAVAPEDEHGVGGAPRSDQFGDLLDQPGAEQGIGTILLTGW